mmetsp:Transcript_34702/g.75005  ORF Transcript_34702/g.75005 Transcript_34702/m.75005 type:complete len:208 (+) Transcript_34702:369-992(+)
MKVEASQRVWEFPTAHPMAPAPRRSPTLPALSASSRPSSRPRTVRSSPLAGATAACCQLGSASSTRTSSTGPLPALLPFGAFPTQCRSHGSTRRLEPSAGECLRPGVQLTRAAPTCGLHGPSSRSLAAQTPVGDPSQRPCDCVTRCGTSKTWTAFWPGLRRHGSTWRKATTHSPRPTSPTPSVPASTPSPLGPCAKHAVKASTTTMA